MKRITIIAMIFASPVYAGGYAEPEQLSCDVPVYGKDGVTILYWNDTCPQRHGEGQGGAKSIPQVPTQPEEEKPVPEAPEKPVDPCACGQAWRDWMEGKA